MKLHAVSTEHTVDLDRLTPGGWVLDAGCRFFDLTTCFSKLGCKVLAIDPSTNVFEPHLPDVIFSRSALVGDPDLQFALFSDSVDAAHLIYGHRAATPHVPQYTVGCYTVEKLMKLYQIEHFDVVKLDCEGAEFDILSRWPGPIATQISVAFHDFVNPEWCKAQYPSLLKHLSQWDDVVQHEPYVRHGHPTPCYWDSLFTLRQST